MTSTGISSVQNDSAGRVSRLVITLKRDANANVVLNNLYKHTPLQTTFGVHMLALVDGVPRLLNLAQALKAYVAHQVEVVTRRSQFRLRKALARAHIVEGLLRAIDMLDAVIATDPRRPRIVPTQGPTSWPSRSPSARSRRTISWT